MTAVRGGQRTQNRQPKADRKAGNADTEEAAESRREGREQRKQVRKKQPDKKEGNSGHRSRNPHVERNQTTYRDSAGGSEGNHMMGERKEGTANEAVGRNSGRNEKAAVIMPDTLKSDMKNPNRQYRDCGAPDYAGIEKAARNRRKAAGAVTYVLLTLWGILVLFPFYWMILTSVKSYSAYNSEYIPAFFTLSPTMQNYADAFTAVPLGRYLLNTTIFTIVTTAIMLVVITLAAFAFARLEFRGKNIVFLLFLSLMMIPNELVIITNFVTITNWDMRNTFPGLILPSVTSVFYIYLLKENFEQIPDSLYYAAKVDGTSDMKYLLKVMVPISKPTLITVTILKVIECWNSYVWPRLITDDENYFLVSNGIQEIRENGFGRENIPAMMAAVVVISVPLIVLFLIFRRKIMEGASRGGTKG